MTQADLSRSSSRSDLDAYPQAWLAEFNQLSRLIERVSLEFGDQVTLRIYDPRAPDGLVKAIRHRIRRYPAFLVAGKQHLSGLDWNPLRQAIELARSQVG